LFGSKAPLAGRLAAQGTLGGNLAALQVTGLRVSLDQGADSTLQATGQIASVTPGGTMLLDGIALEVQGTTATTVLAGWLGRPLPDLGPIQGRFTLSGSSRAVALTDLQLQAGTADRLRIAATGSIAEIRLESPTVRSADLNLNATARDGTIVGAVLEADVPRLSALAYTGRLSGERARWQLTGQARVGRTMIDQDLAIEHESARPRISGTLSIPTLYLADFGFGSKGTRSEPGAPPSLDAALGALDAVDLALHVQLGRVEGTRLPIGRGEMDLTLEDGVLRIDPARFGFVAGTTLVHATANAQADPPHADLNVNADDVQLGEVVTAMGGTPPLTGELALLTQLQSSGDSAEALLSSLDGEASFAIQRGQVDLSVNLATADLVTWLLAGAQRGANARRGAGGRTKLECLVGRFRIEHGVATAQSLLMTTPLTHSTATGTVNFVERTIDLVVNLRARHASRFDPATTYRIHGPMADPTLDFSKTGFLARAIAGLVLKPFDALGALLPLVSDDGGDSSNPCLSTEG
jgi:hypothetical protein